MLTPDQIASLTSDMVWMVDEVVDDQTVLVPVVYLAKTQAGDVSPTGERAPSCSKPHCQCDAMK